MLLEAARKRPRRLFAALMATFLVLGGSWWYRTTRPEFRLEQGRQAIRREEWEAAYAIARQLEAAGESDRALLLRGEALVRQNYFAKALEAFGAIEDQGTLRVQADVLA